MKAFRNLWQNDQDSEIIMIKIRIVMTAIVCFLLTMCQTMC